MQFIFQNGKRIVGFNTENQELNEGLVRFDIVFYVRMKDGLSQIIINVEAQKDNPATIRSKPGSFLREQTGLCPERTGFREFELQ